MSLIVTATDDCNYITTVASYTSSGATFPLVGNITFFDFQGSSLLSPVNLTIQSNGASATIITPIANLSTTNGIIVVKFNINSTVISTGYVLVHCDIDCCLTKLTNELIDCACDCPRCATALVKAQKIFLLVKSADFALHQAAVAQSSSASKTTGLEAGYLLDASNKYTKALEICEETCGCDC